MVVRFAFSLLFLTAISLVAAAQTPMPPAAGPQPVAPAGGSPPAAPPANGSAASRLPDKSYDPQKQCVSATDFVVELSSNRNPVGATLATETLFLPTDQPIDIGVRTAYADQTRYFAAVDRDGIDPDILARQDVVTRRAIAGDTLVKRHLLDADQTIVTLSISSEDAGFWQQSDLYLYTCGTKGSPDSVSKTSVRLSPYGWSLWICAAVILLSYIGVAFALRDAGHTFLSFIRSLDPVKVTAGADGKGSLSKFQILLFSEVVFGLILLFSLQTGKLTDISMTILGLLGITGLGSTVAKGADAQRIVISPENNAWLYHKNWLTPSRAAVDRSKASWRDFFSTDGEFDVYRYQSLIFSLVVVLALIFGGVTQLSTFSVPDSILGIVGLSQAVYIGGKLVTPTNISNINDAISDLRNQEKTLWTTATTAKNGIVATVDEAIQLAGSANYNAYMDKARNVAALFELETGLKVPADAIKPSAL
jgi:hypothetical protein